MAKLSADKQFCCDIVRAAGLSTKRLMGMTIEQNADGPMTLTLKYDLPPDEVAYVRQELKKGLAKPAKAVRRIPAAGYGKLQPKKQ